MTIAPPNASPVGTKLRGFVPSLLALLVVWGVIETLHSGFGQHPEPGTAQRLERVRFLGVGAERPPGADSGPWVPVSLPDDWGLERPALSEGWYELTVELSSAPEDIFGLYWPSVNTG